MSVTFLLFVENFPTTNKSVSKSTTENNY